MDPQAHRRENPVGLGPILAMFECPNPKCGKKCQRLIGAKSGLGCEHCKRITSLDSDGVLHQVRVNKWGVRVTEADARRIKTNKKREDGRYRPDPRWA